MPRKTGRIPTERLAQREQNRKGRLSLGDKRPLVFWQDVSLETVGHEIVNQFTDAFFNCTVEQCVVLLVSIDGFG